MLVLSRKLNESIVIGGGFTVTVLSIGGQRARIGIDAPPEVTIVRDEILAGDRVNPSCDDVSSGASDLPLPSRARAGLHMMTPGA